jgi:hypothetical protein
VARFNNVHQCDCCQFCFHASQDRFVETHPTVLVDDRPVEWCWLCAHTHASNLYVTRSSNQTTFAAWQLAAITNFGVNLLQYGQTLRSGERRDYR